MAQWGDNCLPHKLRTWVQIPSTVVKAVCANTVALELEALGCGCMGRDSGAWAPLPASLAKTVSCRFRERPYLTTRWPGHACNPSIGDSCRVSSKTAGLHRETLSQNETKQNPKQESDYYKMRDIIRKKKDPPVELVDPHLRLPLNWFLTFVKKIHFSTCGDRSGLCCESTREAKLWFSVQDRREHFREGRDSV